MSPCTSRHPSNTNRTKVSVAVPLQVGCPFESGHGATPPVTRDTASVDGGDQPPTPNPPNPQGDDPHDPEPERSWLDPAALASHSCCSGCPDGVGVGDDRCPVPGLLCGCRAAGGDPMSALNESRAWEGATNGRAVAGPMSSEPWSYVTAENSAGRSLHRDYLDAMNADL